MTDLSEQRPNVLWIGDSQHVDFQAAYDWLSASVKTIAVPSPHDSSLSASNANNNHSYDLVVFAQSYPTQFSQTDVEQLTRRFPLAQFVVLLGSWCEGEMRTGFPWPGIQRIYWHRWQSQLKQLLCEMSPADGSRLTSPLTRLHNQADRDLHAIQTPLPQIDAVVGIATKCRLTYEAVADVCKLAGIEPHWCAEPTQASKHAVDVIVYDADDTDDRQWDRMNRFVGTSSARDASASTSVPLIAVIGFPRRQDYDAAIAAGASAVVSKPFDVRDLLTAIESTLQPSA